MTAQPAENFAEDLSAPEKNKRLYLIDASGFIFRAFFALPKLTRSDGTPTGAVMGFVNMMLKLLKDKRDGSVDDHVAVIFDAGRHTFRNEMYGQYKANRDEPPDELRPQFGLVREATEAMGLPVIELEGFEADDVIASYAVEACKAGYEVVIVSSDKDLMQLVKDESCVTMYDSMKDKVIDAAAVTEKFGVGPDKVLDVLALMGDTSDNVPGVPGIGPKTAAQLIIEFGDVESLLARVDEIKQNKRRESLIEHAANARLSRQLITLKSDVPLPVPLEGCHLAEMDVPKLVDFVRKMEFSKAEERLLKEMKPGQHSPQPDAADRDEWVPKSVQYDLIDDESGLQSWIDKARAKGFVALQLAVDQGEIIGLSLAVEVGEAAYLPLGHSDKENGGDLFAAGARLQAGQIEAGQAWALLKPLLADPSVLKISTQAKEQMRRLAPLGVEVTPIDDVSLLSYVLFAGLYGHSLEELCVRFLQMTLTPLESVLGKGRGKLTLAQADFSGCVECLAERADAALRLWHRLKPEIVQEQLVGVYETIERPLVGALARMEQAGVLVDRGRINALSEEFGAQMARLEASVHKQAGRSFALGSPKQLGEVLFEDLSLPGGRKSKKSGQYATGADVLEELDAAGHTIAGEVLQWRQYDKLRNTYTEALDRQRDPKTGRVHTTYIQTIAATGRLSSTDPNLQNIPIRTEEGRRIRTAFVAPDRKKLISADYSQIELRLMADMAGIDVLKDAFQNGQDIHAATASRMFDVPLDQVTGDHRRQAKTINFGIIYGISAHGLAVRLGIDRGVAAKFIEAYFELYPGIKHYMEAKKNEARESGYITTLFGRRVHIAGINDKNFSLRGFAERQAINAPLQGTAADIIKRATIAIDRAIRRENWPCTMLLQVHDELVFEAEASEAEAMAEKIRELMQGAADLSVPLLVEAGVGADWGAIH